MTTPIITPLGYRGAPVTEHHPFFLGVHAESAGWDCALRGVEEGSRDA